MSNRQNYDSNLAGLMANIGLHQHLCLIYETRDEQFSTAIPFLRAGLDRGEKCLYVADSRSSNAIVNEMQTQGIHVNTNTSRAQLEFESSRKIYLVNDSFSADRMVEFLAESVQAAKSSGFSALRGVGKMNWVTQTKPRPEGLIEYEAKLNRFLAEQDAAIMCQYDRKLFPPEVILDVVHTHPTVVFGNQILSNPYYVPPDEFLSPHRAVIELQRILARLQHDQATMEGLRESEERIRRLSGRLLESQEDERLRIARELHDTTAQDLVALATMLSLLRSSIPSRDRKRRRLLSECTALAERCTDEVRTLSYHLHPPVLERLGLMDAIRDEAKAFSSRSGVNVALDVPSRFDRLPQRIELALFRIMQECFTNIQRHSGSKDATVRIRRNSHLTLEIVDMGGGTSRAAANVVPSRQCKPGVGIQSMQERVNVIGGHFEIYRANGGTTVRVTVPLEKNEKSSDPNR